MINNIVILITNLFRTLIIFKYMDTLFDRNSSFQKKEFFAYAAYFFTTAFLYIQYHNIGVNIIVNIVGLYALTNLYSHRFIKNSIVSAILYIINMSCDGIVFILFTDFVIGRPVNEIFGVFTVILIYLVYLIVERIFSTKKNADLSFFTWLALISIPLISGLMIILIVIFLLDDNNNQMAITLIVLGILTINIVTFQLYNFIFQIYIERIKNLLLEKKANAYSHQLEIIKETQYKHDALMHDLKHHVHILQGLLNENASLSSTSKLFSYLTEMEKTYSNTTQYVNSGNQDVDSILNYLLMQAHQTLNDVTTRIRIPSDAPYNIFNLNILLANLLDNAIAAATNSAEKSLFMDMHMDRGLLHIHIVNSYKEDILFDGMKFFSTKRPNKQLGIGLRNVQEIVDKNHGSINIEYNNSIFQVTVMLYLCATSE